MPCSELTAAVAAPVEMEQILCDPDLLRRWYLKYCLLLSAYGLAYACAAASRAPVCRDGDRLVRFLLFSRGAPVSLRCSALLLRRFFRFPFFLLYNLLL